MRFKTYANEFSGHGARSGIPFRAVGLTPEHQRFDNWLSQVLRIFYDRRNEEIVDGPFRDSGEIFREYRVAAVWNTMLEVVARRHAGRHDSQFTAWRLLSADFRVRRPGIPLGDGITLR